MKKSVFCLLAVCCLGILRAQQSRHPSDWFSGKVVFKDGGILENIQLNYDMITNTLECLQEGEQLHIFSAKKVLYFQFYDSNEKQIRTVYTFPYALSGLYASPLFFELLQDGNITLLCREVFEYKAQPTPYAFGGYSSRLMLVNYYYLLSQNGSITPTVSHRKEWLQLMQNQEKRIKKYIKDHTIQFSRKSDIVKMVAYYNSLFLQNQP